jgi:hypothetical protein
MSDADERFLIGPAAGAGDDQSRMNDSTRGQWDWYGSHRRAIERLIVPEGRGGRICVLGAGNCNDLDLKWLVGAYAEVHLVDIDPAALERAVARQGVKDAAGLCLHAPFDLTGIADRTAKWVGRTASDEEIATAVEAAGAPEEPIAGGGFDVVLSPCVLSQLLVATRDRVGKEHARWPRLKQAITARHLSALVRATRPGGRGVMIVDMTSTRIVPGLDRASDGEVTDLMRVCVRDRRCFHGLEPAELQGVFRKRTGAVEFSVSTPWVWHLGFGKAFLCYGMTVRGSRGDL